MEERKPLELTEYEKRLGLKQPEYRFSRKARLTPTEEIIARLIVYGRTNREIAAMLGIAHTTTRHHVESIMFKLNVKTRRAVIEKAEPRP
jgi:DNA-binding CsgD family transcriptional regulator